MKMTPYESGASQRIAELNRQKETHLEALDRAKSEKFDGLVASYEHLIGKINEELIEILKPFKDKHEKTTK